MNKTAKRAVSALLALIFAMSFAVPVYADDAIHIATADDLIALAANCVNDTWSQGKTVELDGDISLDGTAFTPIPYFNGTFNGNGHTISYLDLDGKYSRAGLFGVIGTSGAVRDLTVSGTLDISGTTEAVGGIAGVNNGRIASCRFTGTVNGSVNTGAIAGKNAVNGNIQACIAEGSVFGSKMTGGIVGYNLGLIASCRNSAYVNTESRDKTLSIQDLSIDTSMDLAKLSSRDTVDSASDTGGIAGYSSGIIRGCVNEAIIGYQHVGYNVGGIAGRSCGFMASCANKGEVYGRKDVGGIVGQMEPYMELNLENSTLAKMQQQLNELSALIDQTANDAQGAGGAVSARLNEMSGYVGNAINAAGNINITIGSGGGDTGGDTGSLPDIGFDPGSGSIDLPDISVGGSDIIVTPDLSSLTAAISAIGGQITMLNGAIAGASGAVANDIRAVNEKFNELSNTMFDAIFSIGTSDGDILTDTSGIDIELVRLGKICASTNSGAVSGDINIGGVAGAIAIEYELDPEDDISSNISAEYKREYELKAVLQGCTNKGSVSALRNYAGSIAGRMELGIITGCYGYGDVESENGDYVGGIVGLTNATVRSNWAKCTLSGGKYVGGIVGSGSEDAMTITSSSVSASTVAGNVSMVEVADAAQYYGAVSGADTGEFLENYFVSDTLSGIDGVSYAGRSDRISYENLLSIPGCPDDMRHLTLTFEVDDEVIKEETFDYGASFDADVYPELPAKDGYSGHWDITELNDLHFDTRVKAVYDRERTAIAANTERVDGKSVIFIEGSYAPTDTVSDEADTAEPGELTELDTSLDKALEDSAARLPWYARLTAPISGGIIEQRHISIPDDGQSTHTVHYLPPEISVGSVAVYVMQNGRWIRTDTQEFGSYVTFDVTGNEIDIAAVAEVSTAGIIAGIIGILAVIMLIVVLSIILRRRHSAKGAAMNKTEKPAEDASTETPAAPAAENAADSAAAKPQKQRANKIITLIICLALLAGIAAAAIVLAPKVGSVLSPYRALTALGASPQLEMNISVNAAIGDTELDTKIPVSTKTFDEVRVSRTQIGSASLYFANDMLILENGKAYALGGAAPDYSALLTKIAAVYKDVNVTENDEGETTLSVGAEQADELLRILCPELGSDSLTVESAVLTLKLTDGAVEHIALAANGGLSGGTAFTVDAVIDGFTYSSSLTLPEEVSDAIAKNDADSLEAITDDVMNVISAWSELAARESVTGKLALRADCGPVVLNTTLDVSSTVTDGERSYRIGKNDIGIDLDGSSDGENEQTAAKYVELADVVYLACISGDVTSAKHGESTVYTMTLDADSIERIVSIIAPEAEKLGAVFSLGTAELAVTDGEIDTITINCTGTMKVVLVETAVSVNAELTLDNAK